jgi:hypothetical protein
MLLAIAAAMGQPAIAEAVLEFCLPEEAEQLINNK